MSGALEGSAVATCAVIGFPLGASVAEVKAFETRTAIADGAREVDMVINIGALKGGDLETVEADIRAVVEAAQGGALVKVIIECCLLTDEEKAAACEMAQRAGADFVKTSTGFSAGGATVGRGTHAPRRRRQGRGQGLGRRAGLRYGPRDDRRGRQPHRHELGDRDNQAGTRVTRLGVPLLHFAGTSFSTFFSLPSEV